MRTINLRAKYSIEQYAVLFEFSGNVIGDPKVSIDLVSGDDPDKDQILGFFFVQDSFVSVIVSGGVAGCVYDITCAAVVGIDIEAITGRLAVKSTTALVPPGNSIAPYSLLYTTTPYPFVFMESVDLVSNARGGYAIVYPDEAVDILSVAIDGLKRTPLLTYAIPIEALDILSNALDGVQRTISKHYDIPIEGVDITSIALSGTKKVVLIIYLNYSVESVDITSVSLNGTKS